MAKLNLAAYEIVEERPIEDIASYGYILRHKKSGARVCVIANDDDNKVFSIGFRTPPEDETGVPHIIEHTTLCGSDKFPGKRSVYGAGKGIVEHIPERNDVSGKDIISDRKLQ